MSNYIVGTDGKFSVKNCKGDTIMKNLPEVIRTGVYRGGHIQGIAIDRERKYIYCSFTTELVKLDLDGNEIGSVKGFTGHLGCLAYCKEDGRVYGSLEYKNDEIGRGVLRTMGIQKEIKNAFYIAAFDCEKITRSGMSAETDGVMMTVFLREPTEDYLYEWQDGEQTKKHRFGCSGIDGITFAPIRGETRLLVAYGIYGDLERNDNDYQVILSYMPSELRPHEDILRADHIHESGPLTCKERFFVYTGNTTYGVQNMEYDPYTGDIFLAVYRGWKEQFPNFKLFSVDCSAEPKETELLGMNGVRGSELFLAKKGRCRNGIYGYRFPYGSTGMIALGDGYYYFSEDHSQNGEYSSDIRLYRYTGEDKGPFEAVVKGDQMV